MRWRHVNGPWTKLGVGTRSVHTQVRLPAYLRTDAPAAPAMAPATFELRGVTHAHGDARRSVTVFRDIDFTAPPAAVLGIAGASGAGKSTLLDLLAGLAVPTAGEVSVLGEPIPREHAALRRYRGNVGYVLQARNLIEHLTACDNIAMPLRLHGQTRQAARATGMRWLHELGLAACADRRPGELSGGQQQRVAVARALAAGARLLLADEPTSALDAASAQQTLDALRNAATFGARVVLVSHDPHVLATCDRVVVCRDGTLVDAGTDFDTTFPRI